MLLTGWSNWRFSGLCSVSASQDELSCRSWHQTRIHCFAQLTFSIGDSVYLLRVHCGQLCCSLQRAVMVHTERPARLDQIGHRRGSPAPRLHHTLRQASQFFARAGTSSSAWLAEEPSVADVSRQGPADCSRLQKLLCPARGTRAVFETFRDTGPEKACGCVTEHQRVIL